MSLIGEDVFDCIQKHAKDNMGMHSMLDMYGGEEGISNAFQKADEAQRALDEVENILKKFQDRC